MNVSVNLVLYNINSKLFKFVWSPLLCTHSIHTFLTL